MTLWCGLLLYGNVVSSTGELIIFLFIVVQNLWFLVYWGQQFYREFIEDMKVTKPRLYAKLSSCFQHFSLNRHGEMISKNYGRKRSDGIAKPKDQITTLSPVTESKVGATVTVEDIEK
eukprot:CAMPEP_0115024312 /NCGR_PEP_ID=MMETSP0216-20121206/33117_1 /TAXON_ID=223996 /ORGANISM="Protocruzia adherens, Strain Boccale" /LENGTH=117 /DNA_ID=CAMNT_0002398255 /DNA_START=313 /DNA_END=666 /DNA_ORIENTATION=+